MICSLADSKNYVCAGPVSRSPWGLGSSRGLRLSAGSSVARVVLVGIVLLSQFLQDQSRFLSKIYCGLTGLGLFCHLLRTGACVVSQLPHGAEYSLCSPAIRQLVLGRAWLPLFWLAQCSRCLFNLEVF